MTLAELTTRRSLTVLGINSGTSTDGIDMAVMRIDRSRNRFRCRYLDGAERAYSVRLREHLLSLASLESVSYDALLSADESLGRFIGIKSRQFLCRLQDKGISVNLVASHGQTIRHLPRGVRLGRKRWSGTVQIGSPEQIAAATARPVVADFRKADTALGGEGAPITTAAMFRLFARLRKSRLVVNIGGIANFFYLPASGDMSDMQARDCGPGNVLCDIIAQRRFGVRYDAGGRLALRGRVHADVVARGRELLAPLSRRRRSLGREEFVHDFVEGVLDSCRTRRLNRHDCLASAAQISVDAIVRRVAPIVAGDATIRKLYLTGGGARNRFFRCRLQDALPQVTVTMIDELGIPGGLVEATAFAVLGEAAVRSEALPTRFDGLHYPLCPVSGRIVQPPQEVMTT